MTGVLYGSSAAGGRRAPFLAVVGLPLLLLAACATPEPPPLPQRMAMPHDYGRIWQIDREGLEPSYVFGTFHISDPRVLDIPDAAESAFVRSKIAAFEYDHEKDEDPYHIDRVKLPEGTTLRSIIGARAFGRLISIMKGFGEYRPRNDIKPWVFWDALGGARGTFYVGDDNSNPRKPVLDAWLQKRAYDEGKKVVGLETLEEGFTKYNTIPMPLQAELLKVTLENYHNRRAPAPVVQAYVDGDLGLLEALWWEGLSRYPPEVAQMLDFRIGTNRNRIMVERLQPLMAEGSTFVAVGAGHLPGEEGILRLLEQQGYTVTRLH